MSNLLGEHLSRWKEEKEIYYLIHEYSKVDLNKATSIEELELDNREIFEARLFNSKMELFIYKCNDEWKRDLKIHDESKDFIDKEYELEKKFEPFKSVKVRKYIGYKDDMTYENDMAYIKESCLIGLTKGDK